MTGEIDVIEGVNANAHNQISFHTGENCTVSGSGETGTLLTNDCYQYCKISLATPSRVLHAPTCSIEVP